MCRIITIIFFLSLTISGLNQVKPYTTLTYFKNDTLKLELDLFLPAEADTATPLVIFLHGGGFSGGNKSNGHTFCEYLAGKGIAAASISYTLYMKRKSFGCDGQLSEKIRAIQYAANDLWLASKFLIANYKQFNLDTNSIFAAGHSAGAEAVLHAVYWNYKPMKLYAELPEVRPQYRGIIAGAGAIMDLNLINTTNAIPVFMFHGTNDRTVPYATAAHRYCPANSPGWLMLFGSYSIYNYYENLNETCQLVSLCGAGHERSSELFRNNSPYIYTFIMRVLAGESYFEHTILNPDSTTTTKSLPDFCH